jgi:hypothetical protein
MKFTPLGQRIWGSYYDEGALWAITIDMNGDICVAGSADTTNKIGTPGSYKPMADTGTLDLYRDALIMKLTPAGQPVWATFYGGYFTELAIAIATDASGNVIVGGATESFNVDYKIATPGAYVMNSPQHGSSFLAKFSSNGQQRLWSTYVG